MLSNVEQSQRHIAYVNAVQQNVRWGLTIGDVKAAVELSRDDDTVEIVDADAKAVAVMVGWPGIDEQALSSARRIISRVRALDEQYGDDAFPV